MATLEGNDLRYGFVNERMRALVGAGAEGQRVTDQPGRLPKALLELLPQVYARNEPYVAKACVCTPEGAEQATRYFDFALDPYHDAQETNSG